MALKTNATIASFGGKLLKLTHASKVTGTDMNFNLYLPPQVTTNKLHRAPVLIYLSGLTCTADNCSEKGFFQHGASKHGIAVLYPDTSPRMGICGTINNFTDFLQVVPRLKGRTMRTTSVPVPVSMSTPLLRHGIKTTRCIHM